MRIDKISQNFGVDLQRSAGPVKNTDKSEKSSKTDSVQFSKQAKDLQASSDAQTVSARLEAIPDVRPEKIQEAKEKISSGYFESEEFMDHLANRLLKEFGVQPPA
jgi:flagellar biosynthesis anti-sigma factor FlgM